MSVREAATQQFLVEWYQPALTDAPPQKIAARLEAGITVVSADGTRVRLLLTVAAPTDDVLYGVFRADSAEMVLQVCARAGC